MTAGQLFGFLHCNRRYKMMDERGRCCSKWKFASFKGKMAKRYPGIVFSIFWFSSFSMWNPVKPARSSPSQNITLCLIVEDDSYYTTHNRVAAVIDLALSHVNSIVLPESIKFNVVFQSAGPSCTSYQYTVVSNVMQLLRGGDVTCQAFLGAGCSTTAAALYGIADGLNVPIFGCPSAGMTIVSSDVVPAGTDVANGYPLLIRIPFGFKDLANFLRTFLLTFGYKHVAILRDDSQSFFASMASFIMTHFRTKQLDLYENTHEFPFLSQGATRHTYTQLLTQASDVSRVIIVVTHGNVVRDIMIAAHEMGHADGDYVYLAVELYDLNYWGKIRYSVGDRNDAVAYKAFPSLIVVSLFVPTDNSVDDIFEDKVKYLAKRRYNYTFQPMEKMDPVITGYYEAILIYAQEVSDMHAAGQDYMNGSLLVNRIDFGEYSGVNGMIRIGTDGERDRDYELKMFDQEKGKFQVVALYYTEPNGSKVFDFQDDFVWHANGGNLPPDEPACGFREEKCRDTSMPRGLLAVAIVVPILFVAGAAAAAAYASSRFRKLRENYDPNWWKIKIEDLVFTQKRIASNTMSRRSMAISVQISTGSAKSHMPGSHITMLTSATYQGTPVTLVSVAELALAPSADVASCLGLIKAVSHPNLQHVIGIAINEMSLCQYVVGELCSKGSIADILINDVIRLDWNFKNSLIKDIVQGMAHLHSTSLLSHGSLNSHNCLVDTRFTLKISDYGLTCFRPHSFLLPFQENDLDREYEPLLWRAPELLRQMMPAQGTQKGDVYSFAIILQQIILRSGPFELPNDPLELSEREILREVVANNIPPVRPRVPRSACSNELYDLMERCWEEVPIERPTFAKIKERLRKVVGDIGDNIVDLLFRRMEQYAADLELKVAEKTQQFMDEKERSEQLLAQLLPKSVAASLTRGEHLEPEAFECVSLYFSDIVGFTTISSSVTPMDVISLLNNVYTLFDGIIENYDVYKVETIGDAYMVSSGLPVRNGNRHAAEISLMALDIVQGIPRVANPHRPLEGIQIRVGLNSGPCVAGIVGLKMPRYCLFGDTVNVASRMESTGEPMKIQISETIKDLLDNIGGFRVVPRGFVDVKGKGSLTTFWLLGH